MSLATCADLTLLKSELITLINQQSVPNASTTVAGKIEVATSTEVAQGVIDTAAVTPLTLVSALESQTGNTLTAAVVNAVQTSIGADAGAQAAIADSITDEIVANISVNPTYLANLNGALPAATTTTSGKVELATSAEAIAGTDTERAVTPSALAAAMTSAINAAQQAMYPVGSIYINASSTTNPATLLGFGTWTEFGEGQVLIGQDTGDALFDVLEETGGSKDAVLVSHTHTGSTNENGLHRHKLASSEQAPDRQFTTNLTESNFASAQNGTSGLNEAYNLSAVDSDASIGLTSESGAHTHSITMNSSGVSGSNANIQPYIVVKMWKRTA